MAPKVLTLDILRPTTYIYIVVQQKQTEAQHPHYSPDTKNVIVSAGLDCTGVFINSLWSCRVMVKMAPKVKASQVGVSPPTPSKWNELKKDERETVMC